jgi:hypothetical protein
MRNAARRGEMAEFTISFRITGVGVDGKAKSDFADGPMGAPTSGPSMACRLVIA